jgi:hypothetical protein
MMGFSHIEGLRTAYSFFCPWHWQDWLSLIVRRSQIQASFVISLQRQTGLVVL